MPKSLGPTKTRVLDVADQSAAGVPSFWQPHWQPREWTVVDDYV